MMFFSLFSLTIPATLLIATLTGNAHSAPDCSTLLTRADQCYAGVHVIGDPLAVIPKNEAQLGTHCRKQKENLKCVRAYGSKCLKLFPKQVFSILYNGLRKEISARCGSHEGRSAFLSTFGDLEQHSEVLNSVVNKAINFFDFAVKNVTEPEQIKYICCGNVYLQQELFETIDRTVGTSHAKYVHRHIDILFHDVLELVCNHYSTLDKCAANLPTGYEIFDRHDQFPGFGVITPLIRFAKNLA